MDAKVGVAGHEVDWPFLEDSESSDLFPKGNQLNRELEKPADEGADDEGPTLVLPL
jgi:hypothetical protein